MVQRRRVFTLEREFHLFKVRVHAHVNTYARKEILPHQSSVHEGFRVVVARRLRRHRPSNRRERANAVGLASPHSIRLARPPLASSRRAHTAIPRDTADARKNVPMMVPCAVVPFLSSIVTLSLDNFCKNRTSFMMFLARNHNSSVRRSSSSRFVSLDRALGYADRVFNTSRVSLRRRPGETGVDYEPFDGR